MTIDQRGPASTAPGAFPPTDLPFAVAEFERRLAAVRGSFGRFAIDGMAVTRSESLQYMTGYAAAAGNYFAPFPLVISPAQPPTYVVRTYDEEAVLAQSWITDVRTYAQQGDLAAAHFWRTCITGS